MCDCTYWSFEPNCCRQKTRWETITAFDFATDAIIVAIPATPLRDNTITASDRTIVVTAFGLRIFAALAGMGATVTYTRFLLTGKTSIDLVRTLAWQEMWLGSALIGASIACLLPYPWAFMSRDRYSQSGRSSLQPGSTSNACPREQSHSGWPIGLRLLVDGRAGGKDARSKRPNNENSKLRPGLSEYRVRTNRRRAQRRRTERESHETMSVESDESERRIVHCLSIPRWRLATLRRKARRTSACSDINMLDDAS